MTTWTIKHAPPAAGSTTNGQAAYADSGLRLDDTVTGTGAGKSILDTFTGSTTAIKLAKFLAHLERHDVNGRVYMATDSGTPETIIKPNR